MALEFLSNELQSSDRVEEVTDTSDNKRLKRNISTPDSIGSSGSISNGGNSDGDGGMSRSGSNGGRRGGGRGLQTQPDTNPSSVHMQMEKLMDKRKVVFRWRKLGIMPSLKSSVSVFERIEEDRETNFGRKTPTDAKAKLVRRRTPPKWTKPMS
ncbi:hypothetical protein F3Y22_tig00110013pilonHSYRG00156 [Hibiscus syriacus]|uniref:Uncharacterized protein n=1 Tax=Hibiscus syriacus TaxID=106335 RepID=A0A6A3BP76_HIBSY|nr:hypothetical protein F3Y22_tig00110013pilonHSYRG00156 [Hibiscus syriacus]